MCNARSVSLDVKRSRTKNWWCPQKTDEKTWVVSVRTKPVRICKEKVSENCVLNDEVRPKDQCGSDELRGVGGNISEKVDQNV